MEQQFTIQDMIDGAIENEPTKVQAAFDHLIGPKVLDALEARKREIASSMFSSPEDEGENTTTEIEAEDEDTAPAADEN